MFDLRYIYMRGPIIFFQGVPSLSWGWGGGGVEAYFRYFYNGIKRNLNFKGADPVTPL